MTWIRHATPVAAHTCPTPTREVRFKLPPPPSSPTAGPDWRASPPTYHDMTVADGTVGDLWRCDECDKLWQFVDRPDYVGLRVHVVRQPGWEPASLWQRIRHRAGAA